jgi:hypothetical protein
MGGYCQLCCGLLTFSIQNMLLSGQTPVIRAPTLNRGPTASTALSFCVDGVPGLDGDPFAACAALHSLCCLFFLAILPCAAYVGYPALPALPALPAGLPSFRMAYFASVYV